MNLKKGKSAKAVRLALIFTLAIAIISIGSVAEAGPTFWANSAGPNGPEIYQYDAATGLQVRPEIHGRGINGRGIVDVGNIVYYTDATDNHVYAYNTATNTDLGIAFSVAAASALSTMAYDGTNFWIGDYSGTNHAYLYSPTGTLLKTISLANCGGNCDGLEYFIDPLSGQGRLISNRSDEPTPGTYDVYDTNGVLLHAALITDSRASTGIGFDGTFFYVDHGGDNVATPAISVYTVNGVFVRSFNLSGPFDPANLESSGYVGEDLSFDYSVILPTPEPASILLLGPALIGLGLLRRRWAA